MAYITNEQFIEMSGLGTRQVDENVGTGDNSATSFDLDNDNVIAGSYTLSHAASGSNSFTALTETTHYTLDKESGRIELTAGGVTEVGTDIIYATYWFSTALNDSQVSDVILRSTEEAELLIGRKLDTASSLTEYYDGKGALDFATTNEPFSVDYENKPFIMLQNYPVASVNNVYFLNRNASWSLVYSYDDTATSYTDNTSEANTVGGTDFFVLATTPATDDAIYFASTYKFHGITTSLGTVGVDGGSLAITWEYYDGSSWTSFTPTDVTTGVSTFVASGLMTWSNLSSWTKTTVNSSDSLYWVRGRLTAGSYSTVPKMTWANMDQNSTVDKEINLRDVDIEGESGRLTFLADTIPHGTNNIKVIYSVGNSTTEYYMQQLVAYIGAIQAYVNLSGGSYDDATSYSIGSYSVSIGEVYTNIQSVIREFRAKIDDIIKVVGPKYLIGGV